MIDTQKKDSIIKEKNAVIKEKGAIIEEKGIFSKKKCGNWNKKMDYQSTSAPNCQSYLALEKIKYKNKDHLGKKFST